LLPRRRVRLRTVTTWPYPISEEAMQLVKQYLEVKVKQHA
jgi:hypothetical protein